MPTSTSAGTCATPSRLWMANSWFRGTSYVLTSETMAYRRGTHPVPRVRAAAERAIAALTVAGT